MLNEKIKQKLTEPCCQNQNKSERMVKVAKDLTMKVSKENGTPIEN